MGGAVKGTEFAKKYFLWVEEVGREGSPALKGQVLYALPGQAEYYLVKVDRAYAVASLARMEREGWYFFDTVRGANEALKNAEARVKAPVDAW
jgi:hypothetical protein